MKFFLTLLVVIVCACERISQNDQGEVKKIENKSPEYISPLGKFYFEPNFSETARQKLDSNLKLAKTNFESDSSEENYIWYGRRMAYLGKYKQAIKIYTEGLKRFPKSYKLYRHRGHRYISIRQFDKAISDLNKAAQLAQNRPLEIEPDGIPNKLNQPLSNSQFNIFYHLGLAQYLKGDFTNAASTYLECMNYSDNDDLITATTDWLFMTYQRLGEKDKAAKLLEQIQPDMKIIENDSYHKRLLMYKGVIPPDSLLTVSSDNPDPELALATQGYGVGNWYLYNGDTAKAREIFEKVVAGKHWTAFGYIAAEAELLAKN